VTATLAVSDLESLIATKEIVVFAGSGGVGKTSVAASTALGAATRLGAKVLVLTIDPARRLATALGLAGLGNRETRVDIGAVARTTAGSRGGELWAAMLDTKQSWDDLVLRHAPDETAAYQILENRLYHNLTSRFVQSHDYIAMERLFEIHATGAYDLIVVDTPPSRSAIEFLEAPKRMAEFFGGRLLHWLTLPYRAGHGRAARVLSVASRPFYQVADRVLGSRFLQDIAEFFLNFQAMYDGFVERAREVERLMHDHRTTFAVVSTLEPAPLHEAELFCRELVARRFHLGALVLNRTLPEYLRSSTGATAARAMLEQASELADAVAAVDGQELADRPRTARVVGTIGQTFLDYSVVAKREAELRAEVSIPPEVVAVVPSLDGEVTDLGGLARVADHLFAGAGTQP
jgi:anion-transporting  ArsA/GET3 family ATPase